MSYEISIEVLDGAFPASTWADGYGDVLVRELLSHGGTEWRWHRHPWGVVLELGFRDEDAWERFHASPAVVAALDVVPGRVHIQRGWGGTSGSGVPRRPRPLAGAGAAEIPVPEAQPPDEGLRPDAVLVGMPGSSGLSPAAGCSPSG